MEGCHFVAETSEDLRKHMKKHKRKHESHMCSFCDLRFLAKKDLKAHLKTHAKYKCDKCNKSFKKKQNLGRHRTKCHASVSITNSCGWFMAVGDEEPEVIPMKKYHHCDLCQFKTKRSNNLKRHMAVHRNSKFIDCNDFGRKQQR